MELRTRYTFVLLMVAAVLRGRVYGGLERYKERIVDQANARVAETAERTAAQIGMTVEERVDFVGFVASRPRAARFERSGRYLREIVDNSRFFAAEVVDENGAVVELHGDVTEDVRRGSIRSDVSDRPYVREALKGHSYQGRVRTAQTTERQYVVFSAPILEDLLNSNISYASPPT